MRQIEQKMCQAVAAQKDWQSGNTSVHHNAEDNLTIVRLHGNKIAEVGDNFVRIFDGGWQTATTKSRLNALCQRFGYVGEGVFQKDFKWFVRRYYDALLTHETEEFVNGYTFID